MYMTKKELSQTLRKAFKQNEITGKDISIKVRASLYDTCIKITVKNPSIKLSAVEKIAKDFEEISYDVKTHEILPGANTYVFCQYEYGVIEEAAKELLPGSEKVLGNIKKYSGHKIADNDEKEVFITHYQGCEWTLYENEKYETGIYIYKPTFWIKCPQELAIAMWRFKNWGTIYS